MGGVYRLPIQIILVRASIIIWKVLVETSIMETILVVLLWRVVAHCLGIKKGKDKIEISMVFRATVSVAN